ncbi:O-antigen ligase domain-containing protein [Patescibacteria group bacterium]|nr:MAG: O-antigen ligase domain-containing protein [Patescibacteria group bacterium]
MNTFWQTQAKRLFHNLDLFFFFGLLLTLPFSIRKVLINYPIAGGFNEYSGIYLYLSDIFAALTILSWLFILCNKYYILSIDNPHVIHKDNLWTKHYPQVILHNPLASVGLIFVLWSFSSFWWSENKPLSIFHSIKLLELYLLSIYITYRIVPRGTLLKDAFKLIVLGGVINSVLAIWQFAIQNSVGLNFLRESIISPDISGVAKVILDGQKMIRAYGFFPHPNILGGFLALSIILTLSYRKMFHPSTNVPPQYKCSTWNIILGRRGTSYGAGVEHSGKVDYFGKALVCLQLTALILTFSKSAILGLLIALLYIYVPSLCECSTWNIIPGKRPPASKPNGTLYDIKMKHISRNLLIIFFIVSALISIFPNIVNFKSQSLEERQLYANVSRGTITDHALLGVGNGNLVWSYPEYQNLESWQYQPVHNVFLLIWSELGIIGLFLFIYILYRLFHSDFNVPRLSVRRMFHPDTNVPRGTLYGAGVEHSKADGTIHRASMEQSKTIATASTSLTVRLFEGILLGFIFIMLFDHYLWDIQQGQLMLWVIFGLIAGQKLRSSDIISL